MATGTIVRGYDVVMQVAREHPAWLAAVCVCYDHPHEEFKGQYILEKLDARPGPTLRPLEQWGILERVRVVAGGHHAWYRLRDRHGVGQALREHEGKLE
jgi:hypothetical protein